jgi:hypothetical protein
LGDLGRPSLFKPEFTQALLDYFDIDPYTEKVKQVVTKSGDVLDVKTEVASDFRTLAGFAVKIGVHRDTLHEWSKAKNDDGSLKHPEFSDAYARAKDFQENYLAVNGNKGLIQPQFGMFTAKNVLGWREKQPGEEDKVNINLTLADRLARARGRAKDK